MLRQNGSYAPISEPDLKAKLLSDWQLVKRARFQAADRLGRRNSASLFTLSMVALYGGLITVFVLIFKDSLTSHMRNICDWVSVVANWLTLTFSLTEQIKDYSGQSRALHECAQKVNDLRKHLQATPISASQQLIPFVKAYEAPEPVLEKNRDGYRGKDAGSFIDALQLGIGLVVPVAEKGTSFLQGLDDLFYIFERDILYCGVFQPQIGFVLRPLVGLGGGPFFCFRIVLVLEYKDAVDLGFRTEGLDGFPDRLVEIGIDQQGVRTLGDGM